MIVRTYGSPFRVPDMIVFDMPFAELMLMMLSPFVITFALGIIRPCASANKFCELIFLTINFLNIGYLINCMSRNIYVMINNNSNNCLYVSWKYIHTFRKLRIFKNWCWIDTITRNKILFFNLSISAFTLMRSNLEETWYFIWKKKNNILMFDCNLTNCQR